jgi:hypothetical protein
MFLEKNDVALQQVTEEGDDGIYILMRSYIEHECILSHAFTQQQDLEREVYSRLSKIFS